MRIDVEAVRKDFPILAREVHGVPLVYLDSANTSQKPQVVHRRRGRPLRAPQRQRGPRRAHARLARRPHAYEGARDKVAAFINAPSRDEVIFTKNITEALNLVAYSFSNATTFPGAERFRHRPGRRDRGHRDGAPHQHRAVAAARAAHRRDVPLDPDRRRGPAGRVGHRRGDQRAHQGRLVRLPVQRARHDQPGASASSRGPRRSARCRSSTPRRPRRTCRSTCRTLGADFVAFTGHKLYGPTGVGVLWGRYDLLAELPPFLGGGEMIETVDHDRHDVRRAAAPVRGRHADDRPGGRRSARPSTT